MRKAFNSLLISTVFASAMGLISISEAQATPNSQADEAGISALSETESEKATEEKRPAINFNLRTHKEIKDPSIVIGNDDQEILTGDGSKDSLVVPRQTITPFLQSPVRK